MKRRLAALLAGAMVLTSLPMVSFAKSDNSVTRVPKVGTDSAISTELKIDPDGTYSYDADETFRLKLKNAEWVEAGVNTATGLRYINSSTIEVTPANVGDNVYTTKSGDAITIVFDELAKTNAAGEVKVEIDRRDSVVSDTEHIIAIAGSDATLTSIDSTKKFSNTVVLDSIVIDELYADAIEEEGVLTLEIANSDFSWEETTITLGGFGGIDVDTTVTYEELADDEDEEDLSVGKYTIDGDELKIKLPSDLGSDRDKRGTLVIEGLEIKASRDADFEVVEVDVSGAGVASATLEVAEYVDYGVSVSADEKDMVAGFGSETFKITIEETIARSWFSERRTLVEFSDNVEIKEIKNIGGDNLKNSVEADNYELDDNWVEFIDIDKDEAGDKTKLEFEVVLEAKSGATGDIVATVSGTGLEEDMEVTLGEIETPFEVEVTPADLKVGVKTQEIGDIVVTETDKEKLTKGTKLVFALEDDDVEWTTAPDVETTGGIEADVDLDENENEVTVTITKESRKEAGSVTLTGGEVKVNRAVPEGTYNLTVTTTGDEWNGLDNWFDDVYVNIITPNTHDIETMQPAKSEASFTIGSKEFVVNGETVVADVAPYIANGRTMVSVKYAALGLGIDPANILYDASTRTVTVMDGDRILQMVLGSKQMTVNGAVINMDVASEVVDGRVFVPMSWLAKALNVDYTWDDATKTVTFN